MFFLSFIGSKLFVRDNLLYDQNYCREQVGPFSSTFENFGVFSYRS